MPAQALRIGKGAFNFYFCGEISPKIKLHVRFHCTTTQSQITHNTESIYSFDSEPFIEAIDLIRILVSHIYTARKNSYHRPPQKDSHRVHKKALRASRHKSKMPLDTSTTYPLTKLRLDGRRWNELRLLQAQISTNPASSGSSYLSMGNTSIMCTVHGPHETSGAGSATEAVVDVDVNIAGFAGVDRKRRAGGSDRSVPKPPSTS